ncbi:hypothetical protein BC831DRAFT_399845 [Entophlyctis helioformis]|nr:hypothetical protein BC831DRAFT_399845 [Entophlyctis helioformis]
MGKSRKPKDTAREPNDKDQGTASQGFPRKYRETLRGKPGSAAPGAAPAAPPPSQAKAQSGLQKAKALLFEIDSADKRLREELNRTAKVATNKFQKRKQWMQERKTKAKAAKAASKSGNDSDEGDVERRLKDHVKFGQVVQEPPKITAQPKNRKEFVPGAKRPSKAATAAAAAAAILAAAKGGGCTSRCCRAGSGRDWRACQGWTQRKLKSMPRAEQIALLRDREAAIAMYRQKKAVSDSLRGPMTAFDDDRIDVDSF